MPLGWQEVFKRIVQVGKGLEAGAQDLADFIQNGPETGIRGALRDRYRSKCEAFTNVPDWARNLNPIGYDVIATQCKPYLDDQEFDLPVGDLPFTGGQCADTYSVFISGLRQDGATSGGNQPVLGPIRGTFANEVDDNGAYAAYGVIGSDASGNAFKYGSLFGDPADTWTVTGFQVGARQGGLPDDCGDPPVEIVPGPNPAPNPGPDGMPDPTDNPVDPTDPIVPVPPFEDPFGRPIPFDFPGPEDIPVPSLEGDPSTGDDGGQGGGAPIPVGVGENGEGEDVDFPPPNDGEVYVGAFLKVTDNPVVGGVAGSGPENEAYPATIGNFSLRHGSLRSDAVRVRSQWTFLARKAPALTVTGARVNLRPGVQGEVIPYSLKVCPENQCLEQE